MKKLWCHTTRNKVMMVWARGYKMRSNTCLQNCGSVHLEHEDEMKKMTLRWRLEDIS
jgi:hypothetical protein